jgi:hypothetical protein
LGLIHGVQVSGKNYTKAVTKIKSLDIFRENRGHLTPENGYIPAVFNMELTDFGAYFCEACISK